MTIIEEKEFDNPIAKRWNDYGQGRCYLCKEWKDRMMVHDLRILVKRKVPGRNYLQDYWKDTTRFYCKDCATLIAL